MNRQAPSSPRPVGSARFSRVELAWVLAAVGAFLWANQVVLLDLARLWRDNEDYSHGFLIVPLAAYFVWRQRIPLDTPATDRWRVATGLLLVVGGTLGSLVGELSSFRTLTYVSVVFTVWAALGFVCGWSWVRRNGWGLFLLAFMLPIPGRFYAEITMPLQLMVSAAVTKALHLVDIPILREGNILYLPKITLEVANACSGLRSIIASLVLAYVMACLLLPKVRQRLALIALGVPVAMFGNVLRVLILVAASYLGYGDLLLEGAGHTTLGLGVFAMNMLLVVFAARGIRWCL